ncbi:sucrase ferredoxin [Acaryochloris sp. IP29b_bin.148]|uniref:sucrase ferredoxin n=1 Tax=Acaryochloris sp. IP29b_bin.148 TaxID=2969218 RepID=UPI002638C95F|nr:sucrase ferredoxin [Acaryochloris sp. IP29b_bin.148]
MTKQLIENCQYCSQFSKQNGEDPIGTASTADHWLVFELPQPWRKEMFTTDPLINQLIPLLKKLFFRQGILVRPVAIAPDREYSHPHLTRVIHFWRPQKCFAQYNRYEYLVPKADSGDFAISLLHTLSGRKNELQPFQQYLQPTQPIRDLLICTHTQVDLACGRFGTPLYRQLRKQYAHQSQLRIWQSTHFGGHQFAPTLLDLPLGQFWGHLEPHIVETLITQQGSLEQIRPFYRGWSGLTKFEQIAEGEMWMQMGWDWQHYPKTGRIKRKGLQGLQKVLYPLLRYIPLNILQLWLEQWTSKAAWVDIELCYQDSPASDLKRCTFRVLKDHTVNSAKKSAAHRGDALAIEPVQQYRVEQIVKPH